MYIKPHTFQKLSEITRSMGLLTQKTFNPNSKENNFFETKNLKSSDKTYFFQKLGDTFSKEGKENIEQIGKDIEKSYKDFSAY